MFRTVEDSRRKSKAREVRGQTLPYGPSRIGVERPGGRFGFHEEFRLAAEAKAVVGPAFGFGLTLLDNDLALVMRQTRFVLHIPAEGLEERRDEVNLGLAFEVVLGEVMGFVRLELSDELFEFGVEGLAQGFQSVAPITARLREGSVTPRLARIKADLRRVAAGGIVSRGAFALV